MNRIGLLRKKKGLRQIDFAKRLNITQATLSNWERGLHDPDSEALNFMADFFNVNLDFLLGRIDDPTPYINSIETIENAIEKTKGPDGSVVDGFDININEVELKKIFRILSSEDKDKLTVFAQFLRDRANNAK